MRKKYQIFISSTYTDLIEERKEIQDAILKLEHFPVGMELFSSASVKQWNIIKRMIDLSDYFILIIGYRYGSIDNDGISFTEKEFKYAKEKEVPILVFIKENGLISTKANMEISSDNQEKLDNFIESAKKDREVSWWSSKEDLCKKVITSLHKEFCENERNGWIKIENSNFSSEIELPLKKMECKKVFIESMSDERNIEKRNQIKSTKQLRLCARTGYSFISLNGVFYSTIRESLIKGMKFEIIIQNPWSLNSIMGVINKEGFDNQEILENYEKDKFPLENLIEIYKNSDWFERFKLCFKGFEKLKKEFIEKIELKLCDSDISNSILLSDEYLYLEPSLIMNSIGKEALSLFEFEFVRTSKFYKSCEDVFNFMWNQGYKYEEFIKKEAFYISKLEELLKIEYRTL